MLEEPKVQYAWKLASTLQHLLRVILGVGYGSQPASSGWVNSQLAGGAPPPLSKAPSISRRGAGSSGCALGTVVAATVGQCWPGRGRYVGL